MEYRRVVEHLAPFYSIDKDEMDAFKVQLHTFRKMGIPTLPKVGKGKREFFDPHHIGELHLAMRLHRIGLAPTQIKRIVSSFSAGWYPLTQWTNHYLRLTGRQASGLWVESFEEFGRVEDAVGSIGWCSIVDLRPIARDVRHLILAAAGSTEMEAA